MRVREVPITIGGTEISERRQYTCEELNTTSSNKGKYKLLNNKEMDKTSKLDDVRLTYEQKLEVARWIIDNNSRMLLTGSIMLKERGIDLGREPNDIDILVVSRDGISGLILPPLATEIETNNSDEGYIVKARYKYLGTKIDFIAQEDDGEIDFADEFIMRFASVKTLLERKREYVETDTNPDSVKKHKRDIEIIEKWMKENSK